MIAFGGWAYGKLSNSLGDFLVSHFMKHPRPMNTFPRAFDVGEPLEVLAPLGHAPLLEPAFPPAGLECREGEAGPQPADLAANVHPPRESSHPSSHQAAWLGRARRTSAFFP